MRSAAEHAYWRGRVEAAVARALERQRLRARRAESVTAAATPPPPTLPVWDPLDWDDIVEEEVGPEADAAVDHARRSVAAAIPALAGLIGAIALGDGWRDRIVGAARGLGNNLGERLSGLSPLDPNYDTAVSDAYDGALGQAANVGSMATHAGNAVAADAVDAAGAQGFSLEKTWNTVGDEKVRESHEDLEGETIDAAEPFVTVNGVELMFPGDPTGDPDEIIGCRCWLTFTGYGTEGEVPEEDLPGQAMGEAAE